MKVIENKKHIPKLEDKHKDWLIAQLAIRHRVDSSFKSIAELFKRVWTINITLQTVRYYNDQYPDKIYEQRKALNKKLLEITDIANPAVQMTCLQEMLDKCMSPPLEFDKQGNPTHPQPNFKLAVDIIKLAAQLSGTLVEKNQTEVKFSDSEILRTINCICYKVQSNKAQRAT